MYLETFRIDGCEMAVISRRRRMSDREPAAVRKVTDRAALDEIVSLLGRLPQTGEEMIKMGDVETVDTVLHSKSREIGNFTFYAGRLKAPDTAFYSRTPAEEAQLLALLRSLLPGKKRG